MRISVTALAGLTAAILSVGQAQAFTATTSEPLAEKITTSVRDCRVGKSFTAPLITWGADMVTIHANGGLKTVSGSNFANAGLDVTLKRVDDFSVQLSDYMSCKTPFLRATVGMGNLAADLTNSDPRTKMIAVYQHSWSAGGDALVVMPGIESPADLKGKRIAVQAYGPHVDYLLTVLGDAGLTVDDVEIVWSSDLTGLTDSSPDTALLEGAADAAMVIIPDALALTSGGNVGNGSEGSVKGAEILLSTKTANRVIADVYYVRSDFVEKNPETVNAFVQALIDSEREVSSITRQDGSDAKALYALGAKILLDDETAVEDAMGLWADAETVGSEGNAKFFRDPAYQRRFSRLNETVQGKYIALGMLERVTEIAGPPATITAFGQSSGGIAKARFDEDAVNKTVADLQAQGALDDGTLFKFELNFKPNQNEFDVAVYADAFKKAVDLAATYGGALITVEGHADPLNYLKKKKAGAGDAALKEIAQSARNLSYNRASSVRAGLIKLAEAEGLYMDPSQFALLGQGFSDPLTGMCGQHPCAPKTKDAWLSNMRVVFRIIQVEAEASEFELLD